MTTEAISTRLRSLSYASPADPNRTPSARSTHPVGPQHERALFSSARAAQPRPIRASPAGTKMAYLFGRGLTGEELRRAMMDNLRGERTRRAPTDHSGGPLSSFLGSHGRMAVERQSW